MPKPCCCDAAKKAQRHPHPCCYHNAVATIAVQLCLGEVLDRLENSMGEHVLTPAQKSTRIEGLRDEIKKMIARNVAIRQSGSLPSPLQSSRLNAARHQLGELSRQAEQEKLEEQRLAELDEKLIQARTKGQEKRLGGVLKAHLQRSQNDPALAATALEIQGIRAEIKEAQQKRMQLETKEEDLQELIQEQLRNFHMLNTFKAEDKVAMLLPQH